MRWSCIIILLNHTPLPEGDMSFLYEGWRVLSFGGFNRPSQIDRWSSGQSCRTSRPRLHSMGWAAVILKASKWGYQSIRCSLQIPHLFSVSHFFKAVVFFAGILTLKFCYWSNCSFTFKMLISAFLSLMFVCRSAFVAKCCCFSFCSWQLTSSNSSHNEFSVAACFFAEAMCWKIIASRLAIFSVDYSFSFANLLYCLRFIFRMWSTKSLWLAMSLFIFASSRCTFLSFHLVSASKWGFDWSCRWTHAGKHLHLYTVIFELSCSLSDIKQTKQTAGFWCIAGPQIPIFRQSHILWGWQSHHACSKFSGTFRRSFNCEWW